MNFQPMLAYNKPYELDDLRYPVYGSPKLDGIRSVNVDGKMLTRTLKLVPNLAIRQLFSGRNLKGLDGELIVGDPCAPDCYNVTDSKVMTIGGDAVGVKFYVFDYIVSYVDMEYERRMALMRSRTTTWNHTAIRVLPQKILRSPADVREYEEAQCSLGYEGIILRGAGSLYKFGRSTLAEQYLLKLKRFEDSEGLVLSVFPRFRNENMQTRDERGMAKRSSAKAGKVALNEAGGFVLRDLKTGVEFDCSMGKFTQPQRVSIFNQRLKLVKSSAVVKYRFQPAGVKNKPRFPRAIGFRNAIDY